MKGKLSYSLTLFLFVRVTYTCCGISQRVKRLSDWKSRFLFWLAGSGIQSHFPLFDHLNCLFWWMQIMKCLVTQFFADSWFFLNTLFSSNPSLCSSLRPSFTPIWSKVAAHFH